MSDGKRMREIAAKLINQPESQLDNFYLQGCKEYLKTTKYKSYFYFDSGTSSYQISDKLKFSELDLETQATCRYLSIEQSVKDFDEFKEGSKGAILKEFRQLVVNLVGEKISNLLKLEAMYREAKPTYSPEEKRQFRDLLDNLRLHGIFTQEEMRRISIKLSNVGFVLGSSQGVYDFSEYGVNLSLETDSSAQSVRVVGLDDLTIVDKELTGPVEHYEENVGKFTFSRIVLKNVSLEDAIVYSKTVSNVFEDQLYGYFKYIIVRRPVMVEGSLRQPTVSSLFLFSNGNKQLGGYVTLGGRVEYFDQNGEVILTHTVSEDVQYPLPGASSANEEGEDKVEGVSAELASSITGAKLSWMLDKDLSGVSIPVIFQGSFDTPG